MADPSLRLLPSRRLTDLHPQLLDALFGAAVAVGSLVTLVLGQYRMAGRPLTAMDYSTAAVAFVVVTLRRRWPLGTLAAAVATAVVFIALGEREHLVIIVTAITTYTMATVSPRVRAWAIATGVALILYLSSVMLTDNSWSAPGPIGSIAWIGMAVAVGDAMRTRLEYVRAVEERARRAEQSRDEEARRRVVEERLRIARELHDVVAHHIALINVQAGVASHLLRSRPEQAEEALAHVRDAARTVLDELGTVLGVLRQADDPEMTTEPTQGLSKLSGLLDGLAAAGLQVEYRRNGTVRDLPAGVDLAAYRIIQESLTNAKKHGSGGRAHLTLTYARDGVTAEVTNPIDPRRELSAAGTGRGLVGMRERAAAVGGTVSAGPADDSVFVVHAFLPATENRENR
ncbi:sensor histidine kinase [Melissospora conviva]|uniref:sensor histidine kinase n=1 Tax=Melissospora conviva TaxID=3388432 RepID=UPI003C274C7D